MKLYIYKCVFINKNNSGNDNNKNNDNEINNKNKNTGNNNIGSNTYNEKFKQKKKKYKNSWKLAKLLSYYCYYHSRLQLLYITILITNHLKSSEKKVQFMEAV